MVYVFQNKRNRTDIIAFEADSMQEAYDEMIAYDVWKYRLFSINKINLEQYTLPIKYKRKGSISKIIYYKKKHNDVNQIEKENPNEATPETNSGGDSQSHTI